jgi:hypothetical protein
MAAWTFSSAAGLGAAGVVAAEDGAAKDRERTITMNTIDHFASRIA